MRLSLNRDSRTPLFQQIAAHLRRGMRAGRLPPGTRLPPTRRLATELGVNRLTVANAYAELEAEGLIAGEMGNGTFVQGPINEAVAEVESITSLPDRRKGEQRWPRWQRQLTHTEQRPVFVPNPPKQRRGMIDLASGFGDSRTFPVDEFRKTLQMVMRRDGIDSVAYGDHDGYPPLRERISHVLASQGLTVSAENVLITTGSQQSMALVAQLLLRPGDSVLVENPTYAIAIDLFRSLQLKVIGMPTDSGGIQTELLAPLLEKHRPKLIYTIPNFQNPTGSCLDSRRRRELIALVTRYNIPLLEDDFVGDLRYDGRAQPALKSLDPGGQVIYISSFSKMLMPGLRVGLLAAEGPVYQRLVEIKRVNDLVTSNLMQRAVEAFVTVGRYDSHLRRTRRLYRRRRDAMAEAIERYLPSDVSYDLPAGGLFFWLRVPGKRKTATLAAKSIEAGVGVAAGRDFFIEGSDGDRYLRLNFACSTPQEILRSVKRLGNLIR
jgi:GntR family transcriptional regulator / MocR family aminotransferase